MSENRRALRFAFKRLESELPLPVGRVLRWLRHPASRFVRIPAGILFVIGSAFSFLPVLGLWMLPLGLMLLACDVPFLQRPTSRFAVWGTDGWARFRVWARSRLRGAS
jgi:hypothetical protein